MAAPTVLRPFDMLRTTQTQEPVGAHYPAVPFCPTPTPVLGVASAACYAAGISRATGTAIMTQLNPVVLRAERVIFHVDLDAFFVAVERTLDPSLIGKPVIVGGPGAWSVVSCASYEARKFGVHSAMPVARAKRLCPHAIFLPGRHEVYREVSSKFMAILRDFSPLVEPVSVDEAYVDMSGTERLFGPPQVSGRAIKDRISGELSVTASIGAGASRLIAKVASGKSKPDGLLIVPATDSAAFLAPLSVRELPGIGPRAGEALERLGIRTLGELAAFPEGPLRRELGERTASSIRRRAAGLDDSPVVPESEAKSISAETTFDEDTDSGEVLAAALRYLSERVGARLRRAQRRALTVTLKLRYFDFATITRQTGLGAPVDGDDAIYRVSRELLRAAMRVRPAKVRLIGVGVSGFSEQAGQLSLLDRRNEEDTAVSGAIDAIRAKFGRDAIRRGASPYGHR